MVEPTPFQKANFVQVIQRYSSLMIRIGDGPGQFAHIPKRSAIAEAQAAGEVLWEMKKTAARDAWQRDRTQPCTHRRDRHGRAMRRSRAMPLQLEDLAPLDVSRRSICPPASRARQMLPLHVIDEDPAQPRVEFDEESLQSSRRLSRSAASSSRSRCGRTLQSQVAGC